MAVVLDPELDKKLIARLKELPKVLQDAIGSSNVEQHLHDLADTHKLHLDQWQQLENEVMLTLLGFEAPEKLAENLEQNVRVSREIASTLAADISRIVFEPIRQELERELEHPEAKEKEVSSVDAARTQMLGEKPEAGSPQPAADSNQGLATGSQLQATSSVIPATPPPPPPAEKAIRMLASGAYVPGEASSLRRDIVDDPYRETPQ